MITKKVSNFESKSFKMEDALFLAKEKFLLGTELEYPPKIQWQSANNDCDFQVVDNIDSIRVNIQQNSGLLKFYSY